MFMFMHSAVAQLAPRPSEDIPVGLEDPAQLYDPQLYEELVMRLRAFKAQNRTVFGHVRVAGRRVLRKAKKLWVKAMPSPAPPQVIISENFDIPHIFITEETRTPFKPIRRRARVRTYRDGGANTSSSIHGLYSADSEDEQRPGYEADPPASMFSDDSSNLNTAADDDEYQDLYDILEESECEWGPGDTGYYATLEVEEEADDVDDISEPSCLEAHCGDGPSFISAPDAGSPWTASTPTSVFCPPTPVSTLGLSTPSDGESGSSTPLYTPVLMHESTSYEDALFSEFKAIVNGAGIDDDGEQGEPKEDLAPPRM